MLPIFPEGALTSSVITTVWVGVFVLAFFNLRFGWVMSGLVVPGYIVPLLILKPLAAGVIVVEAVITYLIVCWFSERFARGRFSALFGRDRFMALVLTSIAVRVTLDGWLLPQLADWLSVNWDRQLDWHSNLQSFGLIVISLMANQFWKPGIARGLLSAVVTIGITWLIVRYGLMEFTNFRLSGVTYIYEGLASSVLASPKAYIILVLTAFIASQMNVRYGWDFSGILIPALIALQWYQPAKVLSSFVEAGVIYFLAQAVLKLPFFASMTIEGARKLVLFFNVSFVYKLVLGHALNLIDIDVKTTDFYGFGYLLSTLLAIKAYDKDIFPRVMRSTLEVSVAGAVAGNLLGFALALLLPTGQAASARSGGTVGNGTGSLIAEAAGDAHLRAAGMTRTMPGPAQQAELVDAIDLLESGANPEFLRPALAKAGFVLARQGDGLWTLSQQTAGPRDLLAFNPGANGQLAVVVPDASAKPGLAAGALTLHNVLQARWLVIGAPEDDSLPGRNPLLRALRQAADPPELVIGAIDGASAQLEISGRAGPLVDLAALRRQIPWLALRFVAEADGNRAVLMLGEPELSRLAAASSPPVVPDQPLPECAIDPASRPENERKPADLADLAFLRFEVAEPIVAALRQGGELPEVARRNAGLAGWVLDRCTLQDRLQWRLAHPSGLQGTFLFLPGGDSAKVIESESGSRRSIAAARALQIEWNAGTLLFAPDEESLTGSQRSPFGVISQAVLRPIPRGSARMLQVRKASFVPPRQQSGLAIVPDLVESGKEWPDQLGRLAARLADRPMLVARGMPTAGLEIAPNFSIRYFSDTGRGRHATILLLPVTANRPEAAR